VRVLFAIPPDRRSYFLLKARDFLAALIFGAALILGAALSTVGTLAMNWVFSLLGWKDTSALTEISASIGSLLIGFVVTSAALTGLFRFLTGTKLPWRRIWPGAMLGGLGISVLQLGAGLLLSYTPSNPLLATFAIFIGMLLWFRLLGIVMLVAAAWIAVAAKDHDVVLLPPTEAERVAAEHAALLLAARVRLRTAQDARDQAPWYRVWVADRAVREAEEELSQVEAAAPTVPARDSAGMVTTPGATATKSASAKPKRAHASRPSTGGTGNGTDHS
jgi:membrane protein